MKGYKKMFSVKFTARRMTGYHTMVLVEPAGRNCKFCSLLVLNIKHSFYTQDLHSILLYTQRP